MSRSVLALILALGFYVAVAAQAMRAPRIWDDSALAEWATPVAGLNVRPSHYSSREYYGVPADNLKTYPFYPAGREPAGYWDWLQQQKPQPLVDAATIGTRDDWIKAGERAFNDLDALLLRTNDPALIARARDSESLKGVPTLPDGSFNPLRWVVTPDGVQLSAPACAACHASARIRNVPLSDEDRAANREAAAGRQPLTGPGATARRLLRFYAGDSLPVAFWKEFTVPWAPDERIERRKTMTVPELRGVGQAGQLGRSFGGGMFARSNGSPYYATRVLDLHTLRYNQYVDATATHRLRGPEDVARYAALVTGTDRMDFGPHRILTDEQRHVQFRYADETLYAIGMYLMSLEPPKNPSVAERKVVDAGERIFRREGCASCHAPPAYTNGKLIAVPGFDVPADHPNRADIMDRSVGTDPGAALRTRKGTGLYRIPSLRGVWYRRLLLHDGSLTSLEELFDPARLDPAYEPKGWNPPGVSKRAVPGHRFGVLLPPDEKAALMAFLRSL
jgi:mono/diheme cytochrome c family protein